MKKDSAYVDLLKILLTVGIVLRHAALPDYLDSGFRLFDIVGKAIMNITELCVPLFFVLSGYLFFRGVEKTARPSWFGKKLKNRVGSLLVPYLVANGLAWCVYAAAIRWAPDMMSGFLGDSWKDPVFVLWTGPVNLSLWFIRELIIVCVLSPLIWLFLRYTRGTGIIVMAVLWILGIARHAPIFLFSLGAVVPIMQWHIPALDRWQEKHALRIAPSWRAWCFFIYLYHYLPEITFKKIFVKLFEPSGSAALLAIWAANAAVVLATLTLLYFILKKTVPALYSLLVGGK